MGFKASLKADSFWPIGWVNFLPVPSHAYNPEFAHNMMIQIKVQIRISSIRLD